MIRWSTSEYADFCGIERNSVGVIGKEKEKGVPFTSPPFLGSSVLTRLLSEGSPIEVRRSDPSQSTWISPIELLNRFRCVNILLIDPGMLFVSVTPPADQVLEFSSEHPTVEYGFYLIFLISVVVY